MSMMKATGRTDSYVRVPCRYEHSPLHAYPWLSFATRGFGKSTLAVLRQSQLASFGKETVFSYSCVPPVDAENSGQGDVVEPHPHSTGTTGTTDMDTTGLTFPFEIN